MPRYSAVCSMVNSLPVLGVFPPTVALRPPHEAGCNLPTPAMPIRVVDRYKVDFAPIVEADEGFLLGGRQVDSGLMFDRFFNPLSYDDMIERREQFSSIEVVRLNERERLTHRPIGLEANQIDFYPRIVLSASSFSLQGSPSCRGDSTC
jgi:hypothetical protein